MSNFFILYRKLIGFGGLTVMGILTSFIRYISFGKGLEFNRKVMAPVLCRLSLLLLGVRVKNLVKPVNENVIYFFNHNSFLDLFIVPLLGLTNTRFIISEAVKSILPLHLCNLGIDVLYIPTQEDKDRRKDFFRRVTKDLKENRYSIICSPEGQHEFKHHIAPFNKGVFHMALSSKVSIQTLFFEIPKEANPLESLDMRACEVIIHSKELIKTRDWKEESLDEHKKEMRQKFLTYYFQTYGDYGESEI